MRCLFCQKSTAFYLILTSAIVAEADVFVTDATLESVISEYRSTAATFGVPFPADGVKGGAVEANPLKACSGIDPPPKTDKKEKGLPAVETWIAVIARGGGCNFEEKVKNAMEANYSGAIIFNENSDKLIPMAGDDDTLIPSVFIGSDDAQTLLHKYMWKEDHDLRVIMTDDHPFDINSYLLPFAIVVGICFIIMLVIVVYKCIQDHRRARRHRLPRSSLKKLPIHKFKNGDPFETCCICLDDFEEGDKLRILPCDHGYHSKCIDPWLVKTKRICPQCRKRVFESNERGAGLIAADARTDDSDFDDSDVMPPRVRATGSGQQQENEPLLPNRRPRTSRFGRRNLRRPRRSRSSDNNGTFSTEPREQQRSLGEGTSAQERIRRAFANAIGPRQPILEEQEILSSEECYSSSSEEEENNSRRAVVRTSSNQDAITVRIEQPTVPTSGRSGLLVAEVHVVPNAANDPQPGPSGGRSPGRNGESARASNERSPTTSAKGKNTKLSEEVVVMPQTSSEEDEASPQRPKNRKGKGKKSRKSSDRRVEDV